MRNLDRMENEETRTQNMRVKCSCYAANVIECTAVMTLDDEVSEESEGAGTRNIEVSVFYDTNQVRKYTAVMTLENGENIKSERSET